MPHGEVSTRTWYLLPLRLYAGFALMAEAVRMVASQYLAHPELWLEKVQTGMAASDYSHDFYRSLFETVVAPSAGTFVFLIIFGELLIGVFLVLGLLTRLMGFFGFLIAINLYFARGAHFLDADNNMAALVLIMLVMTLTAAGRAYGVDHLIRRNIPWWVG